MEVSQVEQELACNQDHSAAVSEVEDLLRKPTIALGNKVRLVILYALRYEREPSNRISKFCGILGEQGGTAEQQRLVPLILQHYGTAMRAGDLFGNKSKLSVFQKQLRRGLKGVENVYTQHSPFLAQTLEALTKGTLSEATHPYLGPELPPAMKKRAPTEILVFMIGGVTYEEARTVGEMNAANPGVKIVLGGTTVHNSESFLTELSFLSSSPSSAPGAASASGATSSTWDVSSGLANLASMAPANIPDRKRIAALTSSVQSSVSQGVNSAMSKLQ